MTWKLADPSTGTWPSATAAGRARPRPAGTSLAGVRVALATAREARGLDPDEPLLVAALADAGVAAEPAVWDDPAVRWPAFDLVLVRSTWDYPPRREAFLEWAGGVAAATRLVNEPAFLRWTTDKRYMADLAAAGVPVVPTRWIVPGEAIALPPHGEYVLKPSVGAGSKDALRLSGAAGDAARGEAHARALLAAGREVVVQPYQAAVDAAGETAVVFLEGAFSHAVRKAPILVAGAGPVDGLFAPEEIAARTPSAAELAVAGRALAAVPGPPPLYARVDLVPGPRGEPTVLELELAEPSLFLDHAPGAAARLAAAVRRLLA